VRAPSTPTSSSHRLAEYLPPLKRFLPRTRCAAVPLGDRLGAAPVRAPGLHWLAVPPQNTRPSRHRQYRSEHLPCRSPPPPITVAPPAPPQGLIAHARRTCSRQSAWQGQLPFPASSPAGRVIAFLPFSHLLACVESWLGGLSRGDLLRALHLFVHGVDPLVDER